MHISSFWGSSTRNSFIILALIIIPASIIILIFSRASGVFISSILTKNSIPGNYNLKEFVTLMTWSALKGGLSLALALETSEYLSSEVYQIFLNVAYVAIVIVGGGITADYLLNFLKGSMKSVTVLEKDPGRCQELMQKYPWIRVVYAGGEILDILSEEEVASADTLLSLTDHDETNLVISMYAWSIGIPSVITRVDKPEHVKLLHRVNIDITVSMTDLTVLKMVRFVRNFEMNDSVKEIKKFYYTAENRAEIMEFEATESFPALNLPLSDRAFNLKKDILITAIIRNGEQILPSGSTCIKEGDRVVVTASKKLKIRNLTDILK